MKGTSEGSARPVTASNAAHSTGTIPYGPPAQLPRRTENTAAPTAVDEGVTAQEAFARLAPLLAARRSMRLWNPSLDRYNDRARTLTRKLPDQPAAVPIYRDGRTRLLTLDFDSTRDGTLAVDRDVHRCLAWIREAGGRAITDHSTSGGRHIFIPAAPRCHPRPRRSRIPGARTGRAAAQPGHHTDAQPRDRLHHSTRIALQTGRIPPTRRHHRRRHRHPHRPLRARLRRQTAPPAGRNRARCEHRERNARDTAHIVRSRPNRARHAAVGGRRRVRAVARGIPPSRPHLRHRQSLRARRHCAR